MFRYNGYAIKALRQKSRLNVSALATAVGIRQPHMSLIEKGSRQPSDEVAMRLAAALGLDDLRAILVMPPAFPIPVDVAEAA